MYSVIRSMRAIAKKMTISVAQRSLFFSISPISLLVMKQFQQRLMSFPVKIHLVLECGRMYQFRYQSKPSQKFVSN